MEHELKNSASLTSEAAFMLWLLCNLLKLTAGCYICGLPAYFEVICAALFVKRLIVTLRNYDIISKMLYNYGAQNQMEGLTDLFRKSAWYSEGKGGGSLEGEEYPILEDGDDFVDTNYEATNDSKAIIEHLYSCLDSQTQAIENLYVVIDDLQEAIDALFMDLLESNLEVVKWRQSLLKHLPLSLKKALEIDILDGLHGSFQYLDHEGFAYYIKDYCQGAYPDEGNDYDRRLLRIKAGTSFENDAITFSVSQRGGLEMLNEALGCVYSCISGTADGKSIDPELRKRMDHLRDVVIGYDTENRSLHLANHRLIAKLDEAEWVTKKMGEEISFLYRLLRNNGIEIPMEGHPVSMGLFADKDDPLRFDYEGEYELPYWALNLISNAERKNTIK